MSRVSRMARGVLIMGLGLSLLTGCWDQRPVENRAIVLAVGISADHHWTFLFPNVTVTASSLSSLGSSKQFYSITVKAASYQKALHRVQLQANRQLALGDTELIDLSPRVSRVQLARIIEGMILSGSIRAQVWLAASPTAPSTLLMHPSPQTVVPIYYLSSYFTCRTCHEADLGVQAWRWWDRSVTPGVSPDIPVITETTEGAAVTHVLVYPVHGLTLIMPREVTQGFAYLMGDVNHGTQPVHLDGATYFIAPILDHVTSRARLTRTAVDVDIVIHAKGEIADLPAGELATRATEDALQQATAARLVQLGGMAIDWANVTHTDPFGYAKRATWWDNQVAATIPPQTLATLPIRARVKAEVTLQGEGLAR